MQKYINILLGRNFCAIHTKRIILIPKDIKLVLKLIYVIGKCNRLIERIEGERKATKRDTKRDIYRKN